MKPTNRFFFQAIIFEGGLGIVALFLGSLFGFNFFHNALLGVWELLLILSLTAFLLVSYFVLRLLPFESLRAIERLINELFQKHMSNISVLQLLIISIAAGFGEEFFFRGLLQSGICESINNWTKNTTSAGAEFWAMYHVVIVLISVSILFGLAHAVTKMYFFLAFLISIYLGVILILTDNIFIPVSIHAFYDFVVLVYLRKRLQFRSLSDMF